MRKMTNALVATFSIIMLLTCAAVANGRPVEVLPLQEMVGHYYFLGYNLHADHFAKKVSSVNYQIRGDLIPWGTEVRIMRVTRDFLVFEHVAKRQQYRYIFHWKTRNEGHVVEHVKKVFLDKVDDLTIRVEAMNDADKDGIYEGRAKLGMSREGVLVAIGYPPEFANPEALMTDRDWLYWSSRYFKMVVSFGRDGLVSKITGGD